MIKLSEKHLTHSSEFYTPNLKDIEIIRRLEIQHTKEGRILPIIEIKLIKSQLVAAVLFKFIDPAYSDNEGGHPEYTKVVQGPANIVYKIALRNASKIGIGYERRFNQEWNKTLLAIVNKPSPNKSMLNLGTFRTKGENKENFGLYDLKTPSELLLQKFIQSKIAGNVFAAKARVDEATFYRHLQGSAISRDAAVKYAKVLGCDPSELLFNPLLVPIWGRVNTQEMLTIDKLAVLAGEIRPNTKDDYAVCPREIYRPDVKCITVDETNSVYHNHNIFYYHQPEPKVFGSFLTPTEMNSFENQLVIVGTPIKNFNDKEIRYRYFVGIYKAHPERKDLFNITSIDPYIQYGGPGSIGDEDPNEYAAYLTDLLENNYVIDGVKHGPETFVAPVVSIVNPNRISKTKARAEIIKDHDKFYGAARMSDQMNILKYKELLNQAREKAVRKMKQTEDESIRRMKYITHQSQQIGKEIRALSEKIEQQKQGANPLQKIFADTWNPFNKEKSEKEFKAAELEKLMKEQYETLEKLKEAVSVPELLDNDPIPYVNMDDEDKVA